MNYMELALALAERGRGTTYPNPMVGAVLVRDDSVVGEGWHERRGGPHAEAIALRSAGQRAERSTLYVTLEPCSHFGSTPPCAAALIESGVARVVVGAVDPNPAVRGSGVARLRAAGVEVDVEERWEARALNAGYFSVHERARPWVILKLATTLEGGVKLPDRRWITGVEARRRVHDLRAWVDAVAVGMGTVRADEPRLDARGVDAPKQPRRLAFGRGPLPDSSDLELRSGAVEDELRALAGEGVQTLLLEGGPTLASAFLRAELVDEVHWFLAPLLGGEPKLPPLQRVVALRRLTLEAVGEDLLLRSYVHDP